MNFCKLRTLSCAVLLASTFLAQADEPKTAIPAIRLSDTIPVGPQVQVGKLANGLTYYIQKNGRPEKKLELRLVVKAGSILEDEDQRGLAHMLEHMAFNGSTHFKRHELISYLQSVGVSFGADLNAYTSFDETVYMLPVPTDKQEVVEQGFQVLEDWAHGLSLNDADIDSERGIVLEELRLQKGAGERMRRVTLPKILNGSRYAERLPIGKEEVLKTASYDTLRRFYRDWYRPNLMAVVVVGDIDPAAAKKLIESHFGKLKNPQHERPRTYATVPPRQQSEGLVVTDKEAGGNRLTIGYPIVARPVNVTFAEYRRDLIESIYSAIMRQRMYELSQQANPPFLQGGSGPESVVHGYRTFSAGATLGKGGVAPAINALIQEGERARQFGFSEAEVERAKKSILRSYESGYQERDKSNSSGYAAEYIRNFLEQERIPGIENEYRYANQLIPGITRSEINAAVKAAIPAKAKKLVIYTGTDKAESPPPKADELVAAVDAAEKIAVKPLEEKALATQLMATPPKAGSIVSQSEDKKLGVTQLVLSNGIKVMLKPTDFNNDQVLMSGVRFGGQSLFDNSDIQNARYASGIVAAMGVQDYSPSDLGKILAGKTASASASVDGLMESVSGHSGSADIETMLQLAYLKMTQPRKDAVIYDGFIARQREVAQNSLSRPEVKFIDTMVATLYNNNPRMQGVPRPQDFDQVALNRAFDIYRDRFASAKDFTFFVVGSFDVEKIKPLLATYLASLPVGELPVAFQDRGLRPIKGVVKKDLRMGAEAKSAISITMTGEALYSATEQMRLQALAEVFNIKLIEVLREKMGMIYGGNMNASLSRLPYGSYAVSINLPCGPENVDKVIAATLAEIEKIKDNGVQEADLNKVKINWTKNYRKGLRENGFWMNQMKGAFINGTDPDEVLNYEARVEALTSAQLQDAAKRYLNLDNYVQIVLYPENAPEKMPEKAAEKAPVTSVSVSNAALN